MPEISVIIPAYNAEKLIEETINSVYNQTYKDYELLVVDDESSDNTVKIVEKMLFSPHRIIKKKNGGEASARNAGLKEAQGKYISFLDNDDLFTKDKLKIQYEFLEKNMEFAMCYSNYNFILSSEKKNNWKNWDFSVGNNGSGDIFIKQFAANKIHIVTTLIKKECFEKVGAFDETMNYASDSDMWIRIAANYKIGFINESLAYYRLHDSNVSLDRETCLIHRIASMNKNYKLFYELVKDNREIKNSIKNLYYRLVKFYLKNKEFKKALIRLKEYFNLNI